MLTLVLKGTAEDARQAASLAFNTGLNISVVDDNGVELLNVKHECQASTCEAEQASIPAVDEPHPVFEKADPPSVETVPEPVVPAPTETPAE